MLLFQMSFITSKKNKQTDQQQKSIADICNIDIIHNNDAKYNDNY